MAYTYTEVTVTSDWTEISADILLTKLIQVQHRDTMGKPDVQIMAAAAQPSASTRGVAMMSGDVMTAGLIEDLGDSGKVWARTVRTDRDAFSTNLLVITAS